MRDTRSTEIKRLLKKEYPNIKVSVRIDKYSMGESINVRTNFPDTQMIRKTLKDYEEVDRDESGDILGGGNTFLYIGKI